MYTVFKHAEFTSQPGPPSESRYVEVYRPDGTVLSRHTSEVEATQAVLNDLIGYAPGVHAYEFRTPNRLLEVELEQFLQEADAPDFQYIAQADAPDTVHPGAEGQPVSVWVLEGEGVAVSRGGSTYAKSSGWRVAVSVNGGERQEIAWSA